MKIAVVGNREGWVRERIFQILSEYHVDRDAELIVSGGASGVDSFAQEYAKQYGIPMMIFYPSTLHPIPQRYFVRNKKIVEQLTDADDYLIAFDKTVEGSGTAYTRHLALSMQKRVVHIVQ